MPTIILGISAFYHDSAAALIIDGKIIAAAQEERFTRVKHDASFPIQAVKYVLEEAGLDVNELTAIAFYDKPLLKFERLLETYHAFSPAGLGSFIRAMPVWMKEKMFTKRTIRRQLGLKASTKIPILFPEHHLSHAASAFYPSTFEEAAILTIDGVGEWSTTSICKGNKNQIELLREIHFPHSLGLLYSAFTYYLGFKVNSGEYKVMGLAPYGNANDTETKKFKENIIEKLIDIREDGSFLMNMDYFNYPTGLTMTRDKKWQEIFGMPRRQPESEISQSHMNLALAVQEVLEKLVLMLVQTTQQLTGSRNLVLAGGVALNCVANSKIKTMGLFDNIWIQPAAGDAGGSLGAALAAYYIWAEKERTIEEESNQMQNVYLGPQFGNRDIQKVITRYQADYQEFKHFDELSAFISKKISEGNVIGWFQGRMEFGPRSLGNRSILADPRNPAMQKRLNLGVKYREGFRPFAPSVPEEDVAEYFNWKESSPYMLFVASVKESWRNAEPENYHALGLYQRLYHQRSSFPAITHIDYSARIQTVEKSANIRYWQLLRDFKTITGCSILINTSFNRRGEPMVCTPTDAYLCFMNADIDYLVLGDFVFDKKKQTPLTEFKRITTLD